MIFFFVLFLKSAKMFVISFVHYNLGEKLKSELEHGVPLPQKEACSDYCITSCLDFC